MNSLGMGTLRKFMLKDVDHFVSAPNTESHFKEGELIVERERDDVQGFEAIR